MISRLTIVVAVAIAAGCTATSQETARPADPKAENPEGATEVSDDVETAASSSKLATFGAGCFWCVEAVFQELQGVSAVKSGYTGGRVENPTYEDVCSGLTGHAEVCQITYDPTQIRYEELLEVFWKTHDPTTLNRQGADQGTQYRSAIFYHDDEQRELAEKYLAKLDESGAWNSPLVTEIAPLTVFYPAEEKHDDFYRQNPNYGYCQFVIDPKMEKFRKVFHDKLKDK